MSNAEQKKPPTETDVLRRMLNTPHVPHVQPKPKPAKPRKKK